ncbi:MAG: SDR family oxidoreductase [Gammaproteobacteria bacterium]|nr:SDR family oxidoreductase [Gammaproteobacteria bacterium]
MPVKGAPSIDNARQQRRLADKVAIVAGAGNGIGRGIALMFAQQGAQVVGCDLDTDALCRTAAAAQAAGLGIDTIAPVDLTEEGAAERVVRATSDRHGGLDIVVNAAAFCHFEWIERMTLTQWRASLTGELDIVFLMCRAAWPALIARGGGAILNFASANAYVALADSAALAHCAGKGGVLAMTRQLAMEGAPHGIRANSISPGFIESAATRRHLELVPELRDRVLAKAMLKRIGQPEDIAWLATFLCSDEASWITAADFACDGGARGW